RRKRSSRTSRKRKNRRSRRRTTGGSACRSRSRSRSPARPCSRRTPKAQKADLRHRRFVALVALGMGERRTAFLLLLAMSVCFGGPGPGGSLAAEAAPPFAAAATRFIRAPLLLAFWASGRGGLVRPQGRDLPLVLALGAPAVAGYNALFLYGLELAPASD